MVGVVWQREGGEFWAQWDGEAVRVVVKEKG